jgi:hypothetical protein
MRNFFGVRLVTCPETGTVAAVRFSRMQAIVAALGGQERAPRLAHCSRWAAHGPCAQACAPQAKAPDATVGNMVARWSVQRRCALCDNPLADAPLAGHHFSLRSPDGRTIEWPDIAPETLRDALASRQPVCWNCHISETFRRRYPELVVDREV